MLQQTQIFFDLCPSAEDGVFQEYKKLIHFGDVDFL